jgi:hypothetical protein
MTAQPKIVSTTEYKIEKGVPLPRGAGRAGIYPFIELGVADSVVLPMRARQAAYSWAKRHSRTFVCSPVDARNVRVWRTA